MCGLLSWLMKSQTDEALQERMNSTREHVEIAHDTLG